ncbi:MAG: hypothetical protein J2P36_08295 [Ktedonobacteraceae bacterium]|nr:hypothetical protein [Ktedonobacteraceae bacterium]
MEATKENIERIKTAIKQKFPKTAFRFQTQGLKRLNTTLVVKWTNGAPYTELSRFIERFQPKDLKGDGGLVIEPQRTYTLDFLQPVLLRVCNRHHVPVPPLEEIKLGNLATGLLLPWTPNIVDGMDLQQLVNMTAKSV